MMEGKCWNFQVNLMQSGQAILIKSHICLVNVSKLHYAKTKHCGNMSPTKYFQNIEVPLRRKINNLKMHLKSDWFERNIHAHACANISLGFWRFQAPPGLQAAHMASNREELGQIILCVLGVFGWVIFLSLEKGGVLPAAGIVQEYTSGSPLHLLRSCNTVPFLLGSRRVWSFFPCRFEACPSRFR